MVGKINLVAENWEKLLNQIDFVKGTPISIVSFEDRKYRSKTLGRLLLQMKLGIIKMEQYLIKIS
jgi:hypothetical protein